MHIRITVSVIIFTAFLSLHAFGQDQIRIPVTDFNPDRNEIEFEENPRWSILSLPKRDKTQYELLEEPGGGSIKATSVNSASGLIYKIDLDPAEYPVIEWRWKIDSVLENGDLTSKNGDDYAARIYITFDYDKRDLGFSDRIKHEFIRTFTRYEIPLRAVNYIWANKADQGTIAPNAYTDWVYMIAARSGNTDSDEWITESRNILEDYREAFGEEPLRITGIAIMTDTDDTKSQATAYYGDIIFKKTSTSQRVP